MPVFSVTFKRKKGVDDETDPGGAAARIRKDFVVTSAEPGTAFFY